MRNVTISLMALLLLSVFGLMTLLPTIVTAGYDHVDPPASAQDVIDALMPIPAATARQFGVTDKTRLVYNISELLKACNGYEVRIKALEAQVAALVITPDDVLPSEVPVEIDFKAGEPSLPTEPRDETELMK